MTGFWILDYLCIGVIVVSAVLVVRLPNLNAAVVALSGLTCFMALLFIVLGAVAAEWWQQTSPPHALRMIKGSGGRQGEAANDGTTGFQYDARTDTIVETPASSAPALVDPIAGVREQLARGGAQVAGTTTIDGKAMYKIELPTGVVAYFDTTDYRPMYLDNPQGNGTVVRTQVVTYQQLPMTPDNAKLLSLTAQHPQARVLTRPAPVK